MGRGAGCFGWGRWAASRVEADPLEFSELFWPSATPEWHLTSVLEYLGRDARFSTASQVEAWSQGWPVQQTASKAATFFILQPFLYFHWSGRGTLG